MKDWYIILVVFIFLLGLSTTAYQIFQMTVIDAKSRGLKHPNFWGIFALGGNNNGGLILYLLGRRKYPSNMSEELVKEMNSRKNKVGVGLLFFAVGVIALVFYAIFFH